VATTLRIRLRYLEAIEDGRFDDLPGSVYAVGFIRTYAEFLNLDTEEMVRRFKDEVAGLDRQTELNFPAPAAESRVPGGAVLLIAAVL
ncbi:helix-turn-helix domain-containing protein, partial [Halomonas sp. SIMBA_159]